MPVDVEVISDLICPWCYVGKRRLEAALRELGPDVGVRVTWRAFELNPGMPVEGISRRAYRTAKFGSWERSQALDARMMQIGEAEGIPFAYERMERTPNTFAGHRLVWLARREGEQDAMVEELFRAYFTEGRDIGDREILVQVARDAGLEPERVQGFLESEEGAAEVRAEEGEARALGVDSVPTFRVNGRYVISGAQPPDVIASVLRKMD